MKKDSKNTRFGGRGPNAAWLLLAIFLASVAILYYFQGEYKHREMLTYTDFLEQVEKNNVETIDIEGQHVRGEFKQPHSIPVAEGTSLATRYFHTYIVAPSSMLMQKLYDHKVIVRIVPNERSPWGFSLLYFFFGLSILGIMYFMMRQGQGGGGKIFSVGKSRAKFFSPNTIKIKFKDVAGVVEAKEDLRDIVDFLKNPEKFRRLGAKIPRGILLTGDPGNGKTMLAKAVAGEAHCPFFSVSGSDFVEVFVGVGASRVRDLFVQARKHAPCIVFIDEIDAVGRHRGIGIGGGNDEREQTLNQLLSEMDGFSTEHGDVIVLAATNRPDVLDKALLRPGRFDRKVEVPYPDCASREEILAIHSKGVKMAPGVDLRKIARGTSEFSGADLANLINEAALLASKQNKKEVDMHDFEHARDKILVGAERKTLGRTKEELVRTAYHESGHALVGIMLPDAMPLHKVTILSRGSALGITWSLPEGDVVSKSEANLRAEIMVALGGRAAEELVYPESKYSTGATSDLQKATYISRNMVTMLGMSDLGPICLYNRSGDRLYASEETAAKIDSQVTKILAECYAQTQKILEENRDKLETLTHALVEKETISAEEVYALLDLPIRESKSFITGQQDEKTEIN